MKLKKNKGILFWITGLSGSGKTAIKKHPQDTVLFLERIIKVFKK